MLETTFFRIEPLVGGVYAAIATDEVWSLGNAGIVDLGDVSLVFDTFSSPQAATELKQVAEQLTGHPVGWVINSHWHGDHWMGNQIFCPESRIIATSHTRQLIEKSAGQLSASIERLPAGIRSVREKAAAEADFEKQQALLQRAAVLESELEILKVFDLTLPQITFEKMLTFYGPCRPVSLLCYGEGHTESDAILWLPEEKILFAGDLLLNHEHSWMGDGDPTLWTTYINRLADLHPRLVLPGHGAPGGEEMIPVFQGYLHDVMRLVEDAVVAGKSKEEALAMPIPGPYQDWAGPEAFGWSVGALYDQYNQAP